MTVGIWIGVGYGLVAVLASLGALYAAGSIGAKQDPFDSMVDVVADPVPGCDCEDCEAGPHGPECACEACWPFRMDELVAAYDWDAAERSLPRNLRKYGRRT